METKTTPVHPLLEGTTPGEYIIDGSSIFVLNEDGTNRISAQVQRGWENQWKDGGSRTTNEEVEAVARLFRAAPSLAAENALLAERLRVAKDLLGRYNMNGHSITLDVDVFNFLSKLRQP